MLDPLAVLLRLDADFPEESPLGLYLRLLLGDRPHEQAEDDLRQDVCDGVADLLGGARRNVREADELYDADCRV